MRRAASDEHEDLFWALRGGGGNFGVVTRFTFRLHEVGRLVTGGILLWDAEESEDVAELYGQVTETSSDELTVMLVMRLAPRAPFVPEHWRGRRVIGLLVCHSGAAEDAARELAPIRSTGKPIVDTVGPVPYVELQSMLDRTQADGMHNYWKSEFLPRTSSELLRAFRHHASKITSPFSQAILFQLGGAVARYSPTATPFAHRDAAQIFFAAGCWAPDDEHATQHMAWARSAWEAVRPHSTGGNYVNVQTGEEDEVRLGEAYGANLERLARAKAAYDPDNFFRLNRNIPPRTERSGAPGTTRR
jgi:FAD/FMN-containing dehydrogenase